MKYTANIGDRERVNFIPTYLETTNKFAIDDPRYDALHQFAFADQHSAIATKDGTELCSFGYILRLWSVSGALTGEIDIYINVPLTSRANNVFGDVVPHGVYGPPLYIRLFDGTGEPLPGGSVVDNIEYHFSPGLMFKPVVRGDSAFASAKLTSKLQIAPSAVDKIAAFSVDNSWLGINANGVPMPPT